MNSEQAFTNSQRLKYRGCNSRRKTKKFIYWHSLAWELADKEKGIYKETKFLYQN